MGREDDSPNEWMSAWRGGGDGTGRGGEGGKGEKEPQPMLPPSPQPPHPLQLRAPSLHLHDPPLAPRMHFTLMSCRMAVRRATGEGLGRLDAGEKALDLPT